MALTLDFEIEQSKDRKSLFFTDTTLSYNADINTGGYGGGVNPEVTNTNGTTNLASQIEIVKPSGGAAVVIPTTGDLPTLDQDAAYEITNTDLGYASSDKLPDGVYNITYKVTGELNAVPFTKPISYDVLICGQAEDAINDLMDEADPEDTEAVDKLSNLYAVLTSAKNAAKCSKPNRAEELLDYVTENIDTSDTCNDCE